MQLKNYAGAAAAEFEQALAIRPDNVDLLESVIVCYDNYNLDSTPYRNKLDSIRAEQKKPALANLSQPLPATVYRSSLMQASCK